MPETFRKRWWRSEVVSSEGYSIRLRGRSTLIYQDAVGEIEISSEAMSGSGITVAVYSGSIEDTPERRRTQVMDNIARAFLYAGWVLLPS